ncbi:hypothetical protein F383_23333 [Gossypium arboreum]|uniref:Uncharacterized protein n=1 Tax=Gossypium arboreum TaxID=29729 RepID=A0A0B0NZJ0_GOSAR|nr:hypothetical protein F383_23333 [Gossypium arboreum]
MLLNYVEWLFSLNMRYPRKYRQVISCKTMSGTLASYLILCKTLFGTVASIFDYM